MGQLVVDNLNSWFMHRKLLTPRWCERSTTVIQEEAMARNGKDPSKLRSREWFDSESDPTMTALYLERYMNFGLTLAELRGGKPIVGIAQTGSDLSPCNRHHLDLAWRIRDVSAIVAASRSSFRHRSGNGQRPSGARSQPAISAWSRCTATFHGVVPTTGCDKTTPAADGRHRGHSAIVFGRADADGHFAGGLAGSGTSYGMRARAGRLHQHGPVHRDGRRVDAQRRALQQHGYGASTTAWPGASLPGCAAIPAPHRERAQNAYETGKRIVEMVWEDLRPSKIMTREAFENVIVVNSAIGGSTNAPIHFNAIARHIGVKLDNDDWEKIGYDIPLLVNLQPAGEYCEAFHAPAACRR
jgi:dihydroxy-acid dehydratase